MRKNASKSTCPLAVGAASAWLFSRRRCRCVIRAAVEAAHLGRADCYSLLARRALRSLDHDPNGCERSCLALFPLCLGRAPCVLPGHRAQQR
eukprot:411708-Rhodomonas_salina.1